MTEDSRYPINQNVQEQADPNINNLEEKTIRWIDKNKEVFGDKILCIGVHAAAAEHIAHLFPWSTVVCLTGSSRDEDPDGLQTAEKQAALHAPLWIPASAAEYEGGQFDTVVYCAGEPLCPEAPHKGFPRWKRGTLYLRRAALLMDHYEETAKNLCRHLRRDGRLLSLLRSDHDEYLLGFCFALAAEQMQIEPAGLRQILCREKGQRVVLQSVTAAAGGRSEISVLVAENLNYSLDRMNTGAEEMHGRDAEIFIQADAADLIRGYRIYQQEKLMGKLAVYSSIQRPDVIYYFTDVVGDEPYLRRFHVDDREKVIRHMVGELHRQKATNREISWNELELHDDWSETEL